MAFVLVFFIFMIFTIINLEIVCKCIFIIKKSILIPMRKTNPIRKKTIIFRVSVSKDDINYELLNKRKCFTKAKFR